MEDKSVTVLSLVDKVLSTDLSALAKAELSYGDSWKRRGGVGAFMMLARKWDRLENQVKLTSARAPTWDIFAHIREDPRTEGIIDDIRDLRRYLALVEAEVMRLGYIETPDGGS